MAPSYSNNSGKIVSTVLHVVEHEDSKAAILKDLELTTDADIKDILEKDKTREDTRGDE